MIHKFTRQTLYDPVWSQPMSKLAKNLLSGAFMPVEAMPQWLQPVAVLNPIYHFGRITRGALIKGSGLDALWVDFLALLAFTVVFVSPSVRRFRKQLD
jgi:ABC-2 type transport system permease protein